MFHLYLLTNKQIIFHPIQPPMPAKDMAVGLTTAVPVMRADGHVQLG